MDTSKNQSTDAPPAQCLPQYNEAESAQPHPQQYANPPASIEAYPMQSPPSYNVLYTAKAPNPQAVEFVRVVQHQPQHIVIARPPGGEPQSFIIFSILCVIATGIFAWPCLSCTLPALIFSILSRDSSTRGEWPQARSYGKLACGLNITALITIIVFIIFIVIVSIE